VWLTSINDLKVFIEYDVINTGKNASKTKLIDSPLSKLFSGYPVCNCFAN
jgi:hypothetical protein